uniref:Uncharacterized protein n=1 Tax=Steinernema glaseri TaxID=37863 RepID=A0A1I8AFV7_9BILA
MKSSNNDDQDVGQDKFRANTCQVLQDRPADLLTCPDLAALPGFPTSRHRKREDRRASKVHDGHVATLRRVRRRSFVCGDARGVRRLLTACAMMNWRRPTRTRSTELQFARKFTGKGASDRPDVDRSAGGSEESIRWAEVVLLQSWVFMRLGLEVWVFWNRIWKVLEFEGQTLANWIEQCRMEVKFLAFAWNMSLFDPYTSEAPLLTTINKEESLSASL